jgi:hypothetical protein
MSVKSILKEFSPEEIADAFVLPHGLTKKAKAKADAELLAVLSEKRATLSGEKKLEYNLLQFKFQMEDYINGNSYSDEFTFGHFLSSYLNILNKNRKEFASEIDVTTVALNKWLNNDRIPDEAIMIRLEIHSNNTIPAVNWLRIIEKQTEHRLNSNQLLRQIQSAHVKRKLEIVF